MHSVTLHTCVSEPTTKIWMKINPYYQQQKCSPGILFSSKVRFMWIFAGVCWRGGVKWEWGGRKWRFSILSLAIYSKPSHKGHIYYIVLCSPLVALQRYRNRWPWMTLNGHFALKSVSGSATNGLASPAFGQNCSKNCRYIWCQRQKCSPWNVVSGSIRFMLNCRYSRGFAGQGASNEIGSLEIAIFASFVHRLPNILHTWPHDSLYVMRLSMTLVIFQGH